MVLQIYMNFVFMGRKICIIITRTTSKKKSLSCSIQLNFNRIQVMIKNILKKDKLYQLHPTRILLDENK